MQSRSASVPSLSLSLIARPMPTTPRTCCDLQFDPQAPITVQHASVTSLAQPLPDCRTLAVKSMSPRTWKQAHLHLACCDLAFREHVRKQDFCWRYSVTAGAQPALRSHPPAKTSSIDATTSSRTYEFSRHYKQLPSFSNGCPCVLTDTAISPRHFPHFWWPCKP
jgi:hypothetical protein